SRMIYEADGDAANFIELAVNLAKNQKYGLSEVPFGELMQDFKSGAVASKEYDFLAHSTWRPPVWPFLIAGIFLLFGYNLFYVLIFKFLLHALAILMFRSILKELKLRKALIITGTFLFAVHPAWQLYSRVFLSEPITLFF